MTNLPALIFDDRPWSWQMLKAPLTSTDISNRMRHRPAWSGFFCSREAERHLIEPHIQWKRKFYFKRIFYFVFCFWPNSNAIQSTSMQQIRSLCQTQINALLPGECLDKKKNCMWTKQSVTDVAGSHWYEFLILEWTGSKQLCRLHTACWPMGYILSSTAIDNLSTIYTCIF